MEMKKYKLGEIAEIYNGSTPSTKEFDNYDGNIVWATPKDLSDQNSKYFYQGARNITQKGFDSCSTQLIPANNILMSSRAPIGLFAINKVDRCTNQGFKNIVLDKKIADVDFMYYFLKYHVKEIEALGSGTTFKEVSKTSFEKYEISIPSLDNQQKIASVLSALDDKIALNRRMNAKLEQMAKRLYDHWFVQFDFPNADGKPYKASGGKMVWNETVKREIPEGWEVKKLGDVCEIVLGGTPSTTNNEFWENGTINWLNSGEVGEFPIVESEKKITEIAVEKSTTEFLEAGSVTLSITRYLRPSILAIDACINQSVVGIKENDLFKNCFLYPYLQNEIDRLMSLRTGAQQPHINKEIVEDSFINILPKELMEKYEKKVTPIYLQIINIAKETQKLTVLRDRLLPLLMNGQVEVE